MPPIRDIEGGIRLTIRVQPRASRTEVAGLQGEAVRIRLAAPPVDGTANEELIRFLSKLLKVPQSAIALIRGKTARQKVVEVRGISGASASHLLEGPG